VEPVTIILTGFAITVFLVTMWRGGEPERVGAAILFASVAVDEVYHLATGPRNFDRLDPFEMVLDAASLTGFAWLSTRANRLWPIFAAALQLVAVLGHLAALLSNRGMQRAYWAMTEVPVLLSVLALACGVFTHWLRERRLGVYPDWRSC
jgi:uncharacterized membrane protein